MAKLGSILRSTKSRTVAVTDTGVVIDWPSTGAAPPQFYDLIEVDPDGADVFARSGLTAMVGGDVVTESQDADAHDRRIRDGDAIPDVSREDPKLHTKLGMRCKTGESAIVVINPGV